MVYYLDTVEPWVPLKTVKDAFEKGLTDLAQVLRELFSIPAVYRPLNDIEVEGRKLVATSARLEKAILTLRFLINLVPTDLSILNQAIRMPPEKVQDKKIKEAGARFTCLEAEIGRKVTPEDLRKILGKTVSRTFGETIGLTPGRLTPQEDDYSAAYQRRFTADEWFYANSERERFKNRPVGARSVEGRYKAPAGLIRVTVLIHQNRIRDLIITGDFHPSPNHVIQDMEAALRGRECNLDLIRVELKKVFEQPGVEIPGTTAEDFVAAVGRALV